MKYKYSAEFEIRASPKMIYPYLSTPSGLQEWFADEVTTASDKVYHIFWDGIDHPAKVTARRTNNHIKYQFISENGTNNNSYLEFKVSHNDLTQTSFLKIIDYSEMDDEDDLQELWVQLIDQLREVTGG